MTNRKGIQISGHYVVPINDVHFHIFTLNSKKMKSPTESYCILF